MIKKSLITASLGMVALLALSANAYAISSTPVKNLNLQLIGNTPGSGAATAEISAFDPKHDRLFTTDAANNQIKITDLSNPAAPVADGTFSLAAYGATPNSVAYSPLCGGRIVAAVEASPKTDPGKLVLFDTDGNYLDDVTTGSQPDSVISTLFGTRFISANEGEPSTDGTINPEGTLGMATLSGCGSLTHKLIKFAGVPTTGTVLNTSSGASLAQDLEPEYVATHDGLIGQVTLQENNAIGTVNLLTGKVLKITAIGFKNHSLPGNGLDPSDRDSASNGGINIANFSNVFGLYQPDAIAAYRLPGELLPRYISANEGDSREWDYFVEDARVKDLTLDPVAFSAADKTDAKLGRLTVTKTLGDTDNDGDYDQLYAHGGRGVSTFDITGALKWDSGDAVEQYVKTNDAANWNADAATGNLDTRSDNKGPEIEGITTGEVKGRDYAFAGAERQGGIFAFDLRAEPGKATIAGYVNTRAVTTSPEGILFVNAQESPTHKPLVITSNEVSGNVGIYSVE